MATQQPAQAFASHLINQTLSSIALLESLAVISASDASLIRQKLPSPTGPFPALNPPSPSSSFANLAISQPSPVSSWTVQHARNDSIQSSSNNIHTLSQAPPTAPALPPRQRPGPSEVRAKALWDFNGTEAEDLQFRGGDTIIIDEEVNEQWSRGRVIPNGHTVALSRVGLFPSNYVEKIAPEQASNPGPYYQSPTSAQSMVPYQVPQQGYYDYDQKSHMQMMPPQQQVQGGSMVQQHQDPQNKHKYGKLGSQLGTAAVTGVGFGAGSAVGSGIINSIF